MKDVQKEIKAVGTQLIYTVPSYIYTIFTPKRPKNLQLQVFTIFRDARTWVYTVGALCKTEDGFSYKLT